MGHVADDATATQLFAGAINEANIETASLHNVLDLVVAQYAPAVLHGLLVSETNMNDLAGGILTRMSTDEAPVLAQIDARMLVNALAEYGYMQGILGFYAFENTLDDIVHWFASL